MYNKAKGPTKLMFKPPKPPVMKGAVGGGRGMTIRAIGVSCGGGSSAEIS